MRYTCYIFLILLTSCTAIAQPLKSSGVAVSINKVDVFREGSTIVRIIKHNMELDAKLELELFLPPEMKILDYLKIEGLSFNNKYYDFKNSDGVFIDGISVIDKKIDLKIDYFSSNGKETEFHCEIPFNDSHFSTMSCEPQ